MSRTETLTVGIQHGVRSFAQSRFVGWTNNWHRGSGAFNMGGGGPLGGRLSFGLKDEKKKMQHGWKLKFNSRKNLPLTKYV